MKIIKDKEMTRTEKVTVAVVCDECDLTLPVKNYPLSWYHFQAKHEAWGSESIESETDFCVCSAKCYTKLITKIANEDCRFKNYSSTIIDEKPIEFIKALTEELK